MNCVDYVIIAILAVILGSVVLYLWNAKKKGTKCIGCPSGGGCASCSGNCGK